MPVFGDLGTMPLADLLRWLGEGKTGILEVERGRSVRRVEFHKGFIGSCSTNDASTQFGQFLVDRRKLSRERLLEAQTKRAGGGGRLGEDLEVQLLVEL